MALVCILRQFNLSIPRVLGNIQPWPLVLNDVPHHIQIAHHDDEWDQVHAVGLLQQEYVLLAGIFQLPLLQAVEDQILPGGDQDGVYEQEVRFEHDRIELDVVQALADACLLVCVVDHGQLHVAVVQLDSLDAGNDVVDVAAEPCVDPMHVLVVHV